VLTRVIAPAAWANGEYGALLGLFFGSVGDDETRGSGLLGFVWLHDNTVVQRLKVHVAGLQWR